MFYARKLDPRTVVELGRHIISPLAEKIAFEMV
jgi:hypothetical protein